MDFIPSSRLIRERMAKQKPSAKYSIRPSTKGRQFRPKAIVVGSPLHRTVNTLVLIRSLANDRAQQVLELSLLVDSADEE